MKLPTFLQKHSIIRKRAGVPEKIASSPPSPETSTPIQDTPHETRTVPQLGDEFIAIAKERGDDLPNVIGAYLEHYKNGSALTPMVGKNVPAAGTPAASNPQETVDYFDGMTRTFEALTDHFESMDKLKESLRGQLLEPEEEEEEPGFVDTLRSLGMSGEQIQGLIGKGMDALKNSQSGGQGYHG